MYTTYQSFVSHTPIEHEDFSTCTRTCFGEIDSREAAWEAAELATKSWPDWVSIGVKEAA